MAAKQRLDQLVVERGLARSRTHAQALILAGRVLVNDVPAEKPGQSVTLDVQLRVRGDDPGYVSRGALKLEKAIQQFNVSVEGRTGLDIGASTGGFTDVLLRRGAKKVFCVDVGRNQLAWAIRSDPRVVILEGKNARYLEFEDIGEKVDVITVDVSFISLKLILPALISFAHPQTDWITLIKPQFEVGREFVGKGGIVTDVAERERTARAILDFGETIGLKPSPLLDSPITGTDGNVEYLAHWRTR